MRFSPKLTATAVTIGVFDGVHIAHQRLIGKTVALARQYGLASVVVSFDPDPYTVIHPGQASQALMPVAQRLDAISALGPDYVWVIPFTRRFASITAQAFIRRLLIGCLHAKMIVVGDAFAFGSKRLGDLSLLRRMGKSHGMRVVAVASMKNGGETVSSSRIRRLVGEGKLLKARQFLGRAPALYGVVVQGAGRGRKLGVPTANVKLTGQLLPPQGVYAVLLRRTGKPRLHHGVMNFGTRPTFGGGPAVCEVHLFGFSGSLMKAAVEVFLIRRLRSERCFADFSELQRQIAKDALYARRILKRCRQ